ncbi:MAG: hypothetical protein SVK54_06555 [candidate division WOR-3 bacterium]|nr:hypothetical protein [candidate division WOR-3 bacterium]
MPRPRRIQKEDGVYHVFNKFVEGEYFFLDFQIYEIFKKIFYKDAHYYNIDVLILTAMPSHFHSILRIPGKDLSEFLQRYSTKFARYVNKRLERKGHVFMGRHKSKLISEDDYFLTALAYTIYNPVKDGLVKSPYDYNKTNFPELTMPSNRKEYNFIYKFFDDDPDKGRIKFINWINNIDIYDLPDSFDENKTQFFMDDSQKKKILESIDRRKTNKKVRYEQRKSELKKIRATDKDVKKFIKTLDPDKKIWKDIWINEETFKKHLKWYLLRKYANMSYKDIAIIERERGHSNISEAIRLVRIDRKKTKVVNNYSKKFIEFVDLST